MTTGRKVSLSEHILGVQCCDDFVARHLRLGRIDGDYDVLMVPTFERWKREQPQSTRAGQGFGIRREIEVILCDKVLAAFHARESDYRGQLAHFAVDSQAERL